MMKSVACKWQNEWIVVENRLLVVGAVLEAALDFTVRFRLGDGIPLIVQLFASAKSDLNLEPGAFEIDLERNQGITLLGDEALELHDLLFVHEQAAVAKGLAVENIAVLVGADVDTDGVELTVLNRAVGILEVDATAADALDLGSVELDPCLVLLVDEVVVICFFVLDLVKSVKRGCVTIIHNEGIPKLSL